MKLNKIEWFKLSEKEPEEDNHYLVGYFDDDGVFQSGVGYCTFEYLPDETGEEFLYCVLSGSYDAQQITPVPNNCRSGQFTDDVCECQITHWAYLIEPPEKD